MADASRLRCKQGFNPESLAQRVFDFAGSATHESPAEARMNPERQNLLLATAHEISVWDMFQIDKNVLTLGFIRGLRYRKTHVNPLIFLLTFTLIRSLSTS